MQKFSYHSHTNTFGIYDGHNSAQEMIKKAEEIGFEELGISNHLILKDNVIQNHSMFFNDYNLALDTYKRTIDDIRTAAINAKIKVRVGFEVDYFSDLKWRSDFERLITNLDIDYLIGSTHFLRNTDETVIYNMYHMKESNVYSNPELLNQYLNNYWRNIVESIKSGYFDFIAHLDVCKLFNFCQEESWNEQKFEVIETLDKYRMPYELNTSGWNKCNEQHPHLWMIEELNKRDVPILINDDAHSTAMLGQHYERAEQILSGINYKNRFRL